MDAAKQQEVFDKVTSRAKAAGLLKFCHDGVAVLELAPVPPTAEQVVPPPAAAPQTTN